MERYFCPLCMTPYPVETTISVGYGDLYYRGECQTWSVGRLSCGHTVAERTALGEAIPTYFLINDIRRVIPDSEGIHWTPQI